MVFKLPLLFLGLAVVIGACAPSLSSLPVAAPSPIPTSAPVSSTRAAARTLVIPTRLPTVPFVEATPQEPLRVQGRFVYAAGDGSLWQQAAAGGDPTVLVERSTEAIAQMPAYSPDGTQVVYAALLFLPDGNLRGDIRMVGADGSGVRTVLEPEGNDIVYFYPRFDATGRMLVTRIEKLQSTNEKAWLEWVNLAGAGERVRVVDDARDGDVSRAGDRIAFVRQDVQTLRQGLWVANADGSNQVELVDNETFTSIFSPRFSPDGSWLAFSVHGYPQKPLPSVAFRHAPVQLARDDDACQLAVLFLCLVSTAHAHSAPGSVWRVNLPSGKFQQLTDIYDDSPDSAWSRTGTQLAIHDFTGIRLIDIPQQKIFSLFVEDGGSGGFDWEEP